MSLSSRVAICVLFLGGWVGSAQAEETARLVDLNQAVVLAMKDFDRQERAAVQMLVEEVEKRTGVRWPVEYVDEAATNEPRVKELKVTVGIFRFPQDLDESFAEHFGLARAQRPEGFVARTQAVSDPTIVAVLAYDARGVLFGCGRLLRELRMTRGSVQIPSNFSIAEAPAYPIRGHQIGFRARANSWDSWSVAQMEQYIRELTFFGANSIENIPFQDSDPMTLAKVDRREMNKAMSEICAKYGLDYWVWTPADFDLKDAKLRAAALEQHEQLYRECPELTGVFFPGGDPGDNEPELVMPFLEDVAKRLAPIHPKAHLWLSLQGFNKNQVQYVREYIETKSPAWLGGLVAGPSSPPIPGLRNWLPKQYKLRDYPDITHNKICQYPVPWWDPAFALTLGREAINPRPVQYAYIHNWFAPYTDGFISYSDGVHDDVNKTVWSARSWDPDTDVREILVQYARVFFGENAAKPAADGILALERNWRGPAATNGGIDATADLWKKLERENPALADNWRWQMCLLRANYDALVRRRLLHETDLEDETNGILAASSRIGAEAAIATAENVLARANPPAEGPLKELRDSVIALCDKLYTSIGLQTSVETYHASGAERGAILDFIDYPLNNRWWLEDEFKKIRAMPEEKDRVARLETLAAWEHPGPGSYYDDVGHPGKSPHVLRSEEVFTEPGEEAHPEPTLWWWDNGKSRARPSWQSSMDWPLAVVYEGLDPSATYVVRLTGFHQSLLKVDGERVQPTLDGQEMGEFKEFPIDAKFFADRKLVLTWDRPTDEGHLNWRQRSRLDEIWLLKR